MFALTMEGNTFIGSILLYKCGKNTHCV